MLYIVGLGPGPGYATEAALRAIREADCVFYEDYTGAAGSGDSAEGRGQGAREARQEGSGGGVWPQDF